LMPSMTKLRKVKLEQLRVDHLLGKKYQKISKFY
jgi:hypothetical protein